MCRVSQGSRLVSSFDPETDPIHCGSIGFFLAFLHLKAPLLVTSGKIPSTMRVLST